MVLKEKNEILKGKIIYLRPIRLEDTERIIQWRNGDNVRPYFIYQKPFTVEGHMKWLDTMINSGKGYQFIICENETGRPIGSTYLRDYDEEHKKIEYGIFIGEKQDVQPGTGTEALQITITYAFEVLGVHKVVGRIFHHNKASLKISEKVGFKREALLEDEVYLNGAYHDIVLVGKINPTESKVKIENRGEAK